MISSLIGMLGVGDGTSTWPAKALFCGNGDMSIMSTLPGDDDGANGGVVRYSARTHIRQSNHFVARLSTTPGLPRDLNPSIMVAVVNRARRGVGNMGLLQHCVHD